MEATAGRPRDDRPWSTLLFDVLLVIVAVAVPFFTPVAGAGLIAAGIAGRRRGAGGPASAYLYTLSIALGIGLLVMVALFMLLVMPAHGSGGGSVITPVAVQTI